MTTPRDNRKNVLSIRKDGRVFKVPLQGEKFALAAPGGGQVRIRIDGRQVFVTDTGIPEGLYVGSQKIDSGAEFPLASPDQEIRVNDSFRLFVELADSGEAVPAAASASPPMPERAAEPSEKDASRLNAEAARARAEALAFAAKITADAKTDAQALLDGVERARRAQEALSARLVEERAKVETALAEAEAQLLHVNRERKECDLGVAQAREEIASLRSQCDDLVARKRVLEADVARLGAARDEEKRESSAATQRIELLRIEASQHEESVRKLTQELQGMRQAIRRESDIMELEARKHSALISAVEAEYRTASLTLEASIREKEITRDQTERELAALLKKKEKTERESLEQEESAARKLAYAADKIRGLDEDEKRRGEEMRETEAELQRTRAALFEERKSLEGLRQESGGAKAELALQQDELERARIALAEIHRSVQSVLKQREAELEAEVKKKRQSLEAGLAGLQERIARAETELLRAESGRSEAKSETELLRSEAERRVSASEDRVRQLESQVKDAYQQLDSYRVESKLLQAQISESRAVRDAAAKEREESTLRAAATQEELKRAQQGLEEFRKKAEAEATGLRVRNEQEGASLRERLEGELRDGRARIQEKIKTLWQSSQEDLDARIAERKAALEAEIMEKARGMEGELAKSRLREEEKISRFIDEEKRAFEARRRGIADSISGAVQQLIKDKATSRFQVEAFRSMVIAALDGRNLGNPSAEAIERTRKFWKTVGTAASIPAGIALLYLLFPGIPGLLRRQVTRRIAAENSDSGGAFLQEIRDHGRKFQAETDRVFRDSYTQNVVYLQDYVEMKQSDQEKREWTLLLNDFIVGRLGLSDRLIPEFVSAESVMLTDLLRIRDGILLQFKDQGIQKMLEVEKKEGAALKGMLQTPENYAKFQALEKTFYEGFIKRKYAGK